MGRYNKTIDGVFVGIVGTDVQINSIDKFINHGKNIKDPSKELSMYTKKYQTYMKTFSPEIDKVAKLEEIIMQLRSKDQISGIKLSQIREYLYARCSFYRMGKLTKDIRVVVDKSEFWDNRSVDDLVNDPSFMMKAVIKLTKSMDTEIDENIRVYKQMV